MDYNIYITSSIIRSVITQLAVLENNGKLDYFFFKKNTDEDTKAEIKEFVRLYNSNDYGEYNEKIKNLIDKNNKGKVYSILSNMKNVFINTIEEAKEEEKKAKAKSKK